MLATLSFLQPRPGKRFYKAIHIGRVFIGKASTPNLKGKVWLYPEDFLCVMTGLLFLAKLHVDASKPNVGPKRGTLTVFAAFEKLLVRFKGLLIPSGIAVGIAQNG